MIPQEFVPLHVHYRRDRAVRRVGNDGELVFLRSLAHARANDTAGFIEDFDLDELGTGMADRVDVAKRLVEEGLWIEEANGWSIRSWEKWNSGPDREAKSRAGIAGNHTKHHVMKGIVNPDCHLCSSQSSQVREPASECDSQAEVAELADLARREEKREEEKRPDASESASKKASQQQLLDEFEIWWKGYPRKRDKGHARTAYVAARKKASADQLTAGLAAAAKAWQKEGTEEQFIPHGASWLNGERWEDQQAEQKLKPASGQGEAWMWG